MIFQHQFYFMHTLLSESGYISLLLNYFYTLKKKKSSFWKRSPCLLSGLHWETLEGVKAGIDTDTCCCPVLFGFCASWDVQTVKCRSCCWTVLHHWFSDCCHVILAEAASELVCTHHLGSSRDRRANHPVADSPGSLPPPHPSTPSVRHIGRVPFLS